MLFRQKIIYNGQLAALLPRNEVGIALCHGKTFVPHKLFQLKQRDLAALCKPGGKCVAQGVEGHGIARVAAAGIKSEFVHCPPEGVGYALYGLPGSALLKNGFAPVAAIREQHVNNILRSGDRIDPPALAGDMQNAGMSVYILGAQLEYFSGAQPGFQRQQSHVMQLPASPRKVGQQAGSFSGGKKTNAAVIHSGHLPGAALSARKRVCALPAACGKSSVDGATGKSEKVGNTLRRQPGMAVRPAPCQWRGLKAAFYGRQHGGRYRRNGDGMQTRPQMPVILLKRLTDVLSLSSCPGDISFYGIAYSNRIFAGGVYPSGNPGKKLRPCDFCRLSSFPLTVPADGLPVAFPLGILPRKAIYAVKLSGAGIAARGKTVKYALEFSLVELPSFVCGHANALRNPPHTDKVFIQILSAKNKAVSHTAANRLFYFGGSCRIRTCDSLLKRQVLYRLS